MTQPTALFLADILEDAGKPADIAEKCAAELRRLHAENERFAALVCDYAAEEAPDALRTLAADRDRWHTKAQQAEAQRDALLEALKRMASIIDKMGDMPDGFIHPSPWQTLKCEEALTQARAAIKKAEEA